MPLFIKLRHQCGLMYPFATAYGFPADLMQNSATFFGGRVAIVMPVITPSPAPILARRSACEC